MGRWSLLQYWPREVEEREAKSGDIKVRSIVELVDVEGLTLVPKFLGVVRVKTSISCRICEMWRPHRLEGWSSQRGEWALKSPPMMKLLVGMLKSEFRSFREQELPSGQ